MVRELAKLCNMQNKQLRKDKASKTALGKIILKTHWQHTCLYIIIQSLSLNPSTQSPNDQTFLKVNPTQPELYQNVCSKLRTQEKIQD